MLLAAGSVYAQTTVPPTSFEYFAVAFEQDGRIIPIENHQVTLKKKTFSIVIYLKKPGSVLLNTSLSAESFEQARSGIPFENIAGFSDLGMAEEAFNPKTLIMLSTTAPHYWYYEQPSNHRFNDVKTNSGIFVCRRIVAQVMYRDTARTLVLVRDLPDERLYFVFMRTDWTRDFQRQIERQREYVEVILRTDD